MEGIKYSVNLNDYGLYYLSKKNGDNNLNLLSGTLFGLNDEDNFTLALGIVEK